MFVSFYKFSPFQGERRESLYDKGSWCQFPDGESGGWYLRYGGRTRSDFAWSRCRSASWRDANTRRAGQFLLHWADRSDSAAMEGGDGA